MTLKDLLLTKKWFDFDLDDTLHEVRKASAAATMDDFEEFQSLSFIQPWKHLEVDNQERI